MARIRHEVADGRRGGEARLTQAPDEPPEKPWSDGADRLLGAHPRATDAPVEHPAFRTIPDILDDGT
jgi:hypothetical protein